MLGLFNLYVMFLVCLWLEGLKRVWDGLYLGFWFCFFGFGVLFD